MHGNATDEILKMRRIIIIGICFILTGCAGVQQTPTNADYGQPITQDIAQSKAAEFLNANLKDPYTAQITYGEPHKYCFTDGLLLGGRTHCGYVLVAQVNAKNSFGAYTGAQPYGFFFQNSSLRVVFQNFGVFEQTVIFRNL